MRDLRTVVRAPARHMAPRQPEVTKRRAIGSQLVGDDGIRDEALFFQQFAYQFQRRLLVAPRLDQDLEHLAFVVHRPPQILPLPTDRDEDLV